MKQIFVGVVAVTLLVLLSLSFNFATSRNIAPNGSGMQNEALRTPSKELLTRRGVNEVAMMGKAEGITANVKIGSSPPSCKHKCFGCTPCEAAQVPATSSGHSLMRVQYTNYEPEGWKCKCGPSFYSP